jgi:hypothetical protein
MEYSMSLSHKESENKLGDQVRFGILVLSSPNSH